MNFSIAMAYFERKRQLMHTLGEMNKYASPEDTITIAITDDGSCEEQKLSGEDFKSFERLSVRYLYLSKENKTHVNPSYPFQLAIDMLKDIKTGVMMLQNPECC